MAAYYLRPRIEGNAWDSPQSCFRALNDAFAVLAIRMAFVQIEQVSERACAVHVPDFCQRLHAAHQLQHE